MVESGQWAEHMRCRTEMGIPVQTPMWFWSSHIYRLSLPINFQTYFKRRLLIQESWRYNESHCRQALFFCICGMKRYGTLWPGLMLVQWPLVTVYERVSLHYYIRLWCTLRSLPNWQTAAVPARPALVPLGLHKLHIKSKITNIQYFRNRE